MIIGKLQNVQFRSNICLPDIVLLHLAAGHEAAIELATKQIEIIANIRIKFIIKIIGSYSGFPFQCISKRRTAAN